MKTLPTLNERWRQLLDIKIEIGTTELMSRFDTYVHIISGKLKPGMFVPCGNNGKPIYEPEQGQFKKRIEPKSYEKLVIEYQQALDRVMFDGCKLNTYEDGTVMHEITNGKEVVARGYTNVGEFGVTFNHKTIEDLIVSGAELTATEFGSKQLRL